MTETLSTNTTPPWDACELAWIANAYLDCAIICCTQILDNKWERSAHHFLVPLHLSHLSLELFLKAGIAIEGEKYRHTHNLRALQAHYDESSGKVELPIPEYLDNLIPKWFVRSSQGELFPSTIKSPITQGSAWSFDRLRYASDRAGTAFPELEIPDLMKLKDDLELLHDAAMKIILRIWPR